MCVALLTNFTLACRPGREDTRPERFRVWAVVAVAFAHMGATVGTSVAVVAVVHIAQHQRKEATVVAVVVGVDQDQTTRLDHDQTDLVRGRDQRKTETVTVVVVQWCVVQNVFVVSVRVCARDVV